MLHAVAAILLIAQTLIVPMTGARARSVQTETLFHTLFHDFYPEDDIPAMWLRDASAQTIPYVRFQVAYPLLRNRFAGVIERNARAINLDVYANAFQEDYHAWERKWEVDSIAWPIMLLQVYYEATHDHSIFSPELHVALKQIVVTYTCEEHHRECSKYVYPYRVPTKDEFDEGTGLIWCAFRP
jgi:uncharacterized protein